MQEGHTIMTDKRKATSTAAVCMYVCPSMHVGVCLRVLMCLFEEIHVETNFMHLKMSVFEGRKNMLYGKQSIGT